MNVGCGRSPTEPPVARSETGHSELERYDQTKLQPFATKCTGQSNRSRLLTTVVSVML